MAKVTAKELGLTPKEEQALKAIHADDYRCQFNRHTISTNSDLSGHAAAGIMATMERKNIITKIKRDVWAMTQAGQDVCKQLFGACKGKPKQKDLKESKKTEREVKKAAVGTKAGGKATKAEETAEETAETPPASKPKTVRPGNKDRKSSSLKPSKADKS